MIIVLDVEQAEADLTAGRLACPRCAVPLRPWSWARMRRVRGRDWGVPVGPPAAGPLRLVPYQPGAAAGLVSAAAG